VPTETAPQPSAASRAARYAAHVNPQWVRLLDLLGMNVRYERSVGDELWAENGIRYLDFLSGYCVYNIGHNHPRLVTELQAELGRGGPAMLQSHVAELAGELAAALCARAGGALNKVYFCSSGSEGIETVIKFARARTRRTRLLSAAGAFHGLTCGALSLMDTPFWTAGFGPLLPGMDAVPFGDVAAATRMLETRQYAAIVLEPVQAEAGIRVPDPGYLREVQRLCVRTGTLLVLDEVQTGLCRTGTFLAAQRYGLQPDMVVLAKALSGGLVPVAAVLMSDAVFDAVYDSVPRAFVHASTFGENRLAMRAGLVTLDILDDEDLGARSEKVGARLRAELTRALRPYEMVAEVRGVGLLCGIAFRPPERLALRVPFTLFRKAHPALFGQMVVRHLFRRHRILTQICGNDFDVLKVAPPLVVPSASLETFVGAMRDTMEQVHSSSGFWTDALALAARAARDLTYTA
jgi:ornithine--oxo-acid transaminase